MSVSVLQQGALRTEKTKLTDTSATTVYTPTGDAACVVQAINVANTDGSTRTVILDVYDGSTAYEIVDEADIATKARLNVDNIPIVLKPGEVIRAKASQGNTLVVIVTAMEQGRFVAR